MKVKIVSEDLVNNNYTLSIVDDDGNEVYGRPLEYIKPEPKNTSKTEKQKQESLDKKVDDIIYHTIYSSEKYYSIEKKNIEINTKIEVVKEEVEEIKEAEEAPIKELEKVV